MGCGDAEMRRGATELSMMFKDASPKKKKNKTGKAAPSTTTDLKANNGRDAHALGCVNNLLQLPAGDVANAEIEDLAAVDEVAHGTQRLLDGRA